MGGLRFAWFSGDVVVEAVSRNQKFAINAACKEPSGAYFSPYGFYVHPKHLGSFFN